MMKSLSTRNWSLCMLAAAMLGGAPLLAQQPNALHTAIQNERLNHTAVPYSLFSLSAERDAQIDASINNVVYLKLNRQALNAVIGSNASLISFSLPLKEGAQAFTLTSFNILDDGFKVLERGADGKRKEVQVETGVFYRGVLDSKFNSLAAFTFARAEVLAVFSTPEGGNYNLVLNYEHPGVNRDNYILFREADIIDPHHTPCGVTDDMHKLADPAGGQTAAKGTFNSCHKVRVSLHGDYQMYQKKGNNTTACVNYLTNLLNVISVLYNNEGINMVLSETEVNAAPDGYTYGGSDEVLFKFGEDMQNGFNGDIAQMVSGYNENGWPPLGGLAWLDMLCQQPVQLQSGQWYGPFSMSDNDIMNNIPNIPVYSWDVEASAHEMGHNIGSPHTQSCSWPGGAIDDCYTTEGGCAPGPTPVNGGTIMSYCHLSQTGINFANGFGPLPGDLIRAKVATSSCLTSFTPLKTLTTASITRTANRQCNDGSWTNYYYDNNTATEADDELLLAIKANGQDIGNVDVTGVQVKMTTAQAYGTNTGRTVTAPYAAAGWKEVNRTWSVTLPAAMQPTAAVSIRFPFTNQDMLDVKGSIPALTQSSQLSLVAFKNQNAAANPNTATSGDINTYTNAAAADATHWKLGTETNYSYAEFVSNTGIYGGSMGFRAPVSGIGDLYEGNKLLYIYPNPAAGVLHIRIPDNVKTRSHSVQVFDNLGRLVISREEMTMQNGVLKLDISGLTTGVYSVRYLGEDAPFNAMFVKQ